MREDALRDVLLVRAFEEGDQAGELIGAQERQIATREVRNELATGGKEPDPETFLSRRARRLRERILRSHPRAERIFALSARRGLPRWVALVGGVVIGGAVDHLGSAKTINLLNFPILGFLVYNLLVYLALFLSDLWGWRRKAGPEGGRSRSTARGLVARLILWFASPDRFWRRSSTGGEGRAAVCAQRYARDWLRIGAPLHLARGATWMHLGAAGLMLGAIAGLYLRGLVLQYDASWESTFLTPNAVHGLLEFIFWPAAWLIEQPLPPVADIAAMQAPDGIPGDAAQWIHYYGITGVLFVVLPRLVLAMFAARRSAKLSRNLPLDYQSDAYFLRLLAVERGKGACAVVQAYSYHAPPRAADGLKALLLDLLGGRVKVLALDPAAYGAEPAPDPPDGSSPSLCRVTLFSLAQSPEEEVHGRFLESLKERAKDQVGHRALLVVIDSGPYRDRLGRNEEALERLEERERTWRRLLRGVGLDALVYDLSAPPDAVLLEDARAAMWPAPLGEGEA